MIPLLAKVDCVLFDLDGTLVETDIDFPLMRRRITALAVEHGMDPEPLASMDLLRIVDFGVSYLRRHGRAPDAAALRDRALAILEEIEMRHAQDTQDIPFAKELLGELRSRAIPIGIVTRNCRKASWISLDIAGIKPDVLICREDTARRKPHPDPLHVALGIFRARAGNSIMVGDYIWDVQSGKSAGMKTIGFLRPNRPPDFFAGVEPDLVATDLQEVLDAIVDRNS